MASRTRPSATFLMATALAFVAGACVDHRCPKGYDQRGDTCYRIRDAGADGGDAADGGGPQTPDAELDDAAAEPVTIGPGSCNDGCGAHASCDMENDVCECDSGYVETSAGCVRDPCVQGQACDEPCNRDADCTDKTCHTKTCTSGRCVYTELMPGESGNCASGLVCTATQECKECVSDEQCDHVDGTCADGICDTSSNTCQAKPKSGSCGNLKICVGMSCADSCGNGAVDAVAGEECDPKATAAGWDDWSCNRETCRRTGLLSSTSYHQCAGDSDCTPNETCTRTALQPVIPVCIPKCNRGTCQAPPGYTAVIPRDRTRTWCDDATGYECWINCEVDDDCPPSVKCLGNVCAYYDP